MFHWSSFIDTLLMKALLGKTTTVPTLSDSQSLNSLHNIPLMDGIYREMHGVDAIFVLGKWVSMENKEYNVQQKLQ